MPIFTYFGHFCPFYTKFHCTRLTANICTWWVTIGHFIQKTLMTSLLLTQRRLTRKQLRPRWEWKTFLLKSTKNISEFPCFCFDPDSQRGHICCTFLIKNEKEKSYIVLCVPSLKYVKKNKKIATILFTLVLLLFKKSYFNIFVNI